MKAKQRPAKQGMAVPPKAAQGMAAATYPPLVIGTISQTLTASRREVTLGKVGL